MTPGVMLAVTACSMHVAGAQKDSPKYFLSSKTSLSIRGPASDDDKENNLPTSLIMTPLMNFFPAVIKEENYPIFSKHISITRLQKQAKYGCKLRKLCMTGNI